MFNKEFTQLWRKATAKNPEPVEQSEQPAPVKKTRKKKGADK